MIFQMASIAYCNPFIPPEWIAAHGLKPHWLQPEKVTATFCRNGPEGASHRRWLSPFPAQRGVCPAAAALADAILQNPSDAAVALTTTCDQLRYAAALLEHQGAIPVFLMHVPRSWQTPSARSFYCDELRRLGRFLVQHGGTEPTANRLRETMLRYDRARADLHGRRETMSPLDFFRAVIAVRGDISRLAAADTAAPESSKAQAAVPAAAKRNLALLGGPLPADVGQLFRIIKRAGGRIVLDATESGERTLPPPFDADRLGANPLEELARAYFDEIPDVFRRPNDRLYIWLRQQIAERKITGLLVRRYVWCDLWHAELPRLAQELALPVLDWDVADDDPGANARFTGRLEAFLEM
jgi:benzoyl-CoA reductase/2-hydroxyglutaryl-CoA dehydratase subunit BcrC/BadD/HgdB